MGTTTLGELIPVLQVAIGPVILISGVGLLLLSMTNRFGRVVDRSRLLLADLRVAAGPERERAQAQARILARRARLVRLAILCTTVSVLLAAVLITVLFLTALLGIEVAWLGAGLFIGSMAALVAGLVPFLQDVNLSLVALRLEVGDEG